MESYSLRPELQLLFSAAELAMAKERLACFDELVETTMRVVRVRSRQS